MEEGETDEKTFFICEVCNEMFNNKAGLESHRQDKHVIRTYNCAVCVTYFEKHEHLLEHMQNHVAVFLFKCQNCGKTFSNITDLRLHMEEHVVMKKYVCCLCTDRFGNIDIFQLHLKKVHDIKPKASENQESATTHGKIQKGAENVITCKEYKCEFCDAHFENDQLLFSHVKDHAKSQQKDQPYPKLAENVLTEESNLNFKIAEVSSISNVTSNSDTSVLISSPSSKKSNKVHGNTLVFVHKTDKGNFVCQLCQKTFAFRENLLLHLKTHPSVEGQPSVQTSVIQNSSKPYTYKKDQFPCLKCNESFAFEENLHLHLKTHEGDLTPNSKKKSMMQCDECGIFILDPQEFSLHLKMHQDFQCSKCGAVFSDPLEFDTHERLHVLSDLTCDICQEQFVSKDALNLHRKIRHEKKTLMCGVCGDVFGNDELKEHMKAHSKSAKTEKCDICNEMVLKSKFEAHMEMHDISDFYYCDVCDDEFDCEEEFQIHLSSHFICKICKKLFNLQSQLDQHILTHNQNCKICDLTFDTLESLKEHENSQHVENETEISTKEESRIEIDEDKTIQPGEEMKVLVVADPSYVYSNAFSHDHGGLACRSHENKGLESKISNGDASNDASVPDASLSNQPNANKPSTGVKVGIPFKAKITCEYCPRRFRYTLAYENHLKDHPKQCKVCGEIFRKLANLRVHERSHVSEVDEGTLAPQFIIDACNMCAKEFSTEAEMIKHQTTHARTTTEKENKPTTSSQIAEVESNKIIHEQNIKKEPEDQSESMIQNVNEKLSVKCDLDDEDDMKDHMASIHKYYNNVSNISFNGITERKIQQDTHFPSTPVLRCSYDFCGIKFESENDLNEHVKSHNIEPKLESLSILNLTPSSISPGSAILQILNTAPVSNEPQTCERGDQETLGEDANVREVPDDQNLIENKPLDVDVSLNCELCSTSVADETEMQRHMEASHKNITYRCDVCFILFSTRELYDSHRRTHFERKKSFVCRAKRCTARFSTSNALNEHARGHVLKHSIKKSLSDAIAAKKRRREMGAEKPYPVTEKKLMICEICDERFLNYEIRQIQLHEEKHRLEEMKTKSESVLKCELCSQIMCDEKELLTHMRTIHKGIKFRCEVCLTLLSSKPEFDRHKKTHIPHYGLIKKCSVRLKRLSSELI